MCKLLLVVPALLLLAPQAFAAPILSATPSSIALSPTSTMITLSINTNDGITDTPLTALDLDLRALTSGLQIVSVVSLVPSITASGPTPSGSDTLASFVGTFGPPPASGVIDVGTITVEGFVAGTPLRASGNYTDASFNDIPFADNSLATVVPEPATAALIGLGMALLAARRRSVV